MASDDKPAVQIRTTPEDFRVDEIAAYEPSGQGDHLYVRFEKRGLDTFEAVRRLASRLGVSARDAGTAGLKDRHAVTTQTASFAFALAKPVPQATDLDGEGIRVLSVARHNNKLRTGHLRGNRFTLVLRGIDEGAKARLEASFERLRSNGMPNWFGVQRFGRHGDNAERARRWVQGDGKPPRDPKVRRLEFSSLQSELFHQLLKRRVDEGTWATRLVGDLVVRPHGGRTMTYTEPFLAADGELWLPSGPLFGARMPWPSGRPLELEREVLAGSGITEEVLTRWKVLGEGARRPLQLVPEEIRVSPVADDSRALEVAFVLPRGAYATTVLEAVCTVHDATRPGRPAPSATDSDADEPEADSPEG